MQDNDEKCPRCGGPAIIWRPYIDGVAWVNWYCDCPAKEADDAK